MQQAVQKRSVTVNEFMEETGAKPSSTWKMIRDGRLPVIRMGRRVLISRDVLERFLRGDFSAPSLSDDDNRAA
jgi:excisionase family DNA binding protein